MSGTRGPALTARVSSGTVGGRAARMRRRGPIGGAATAGRPQGGRAVGRAGQRRRARRLPAHAGGSFRGASGAGTDVRARGGRATGRADAGAAPRLGRDGGPQLGGLLRATRRTVPRRRPRPSRPRTWPAVAGAVPADRLRRRRGGAGRGARHRAVHGRRVLDGRADRPAALPPPPRRGRRARALRHECPVPRDVTRTGAVGDRQRELRDRCRATAAAPDRRRDGRGARLARQSGSRRASRGRRPRLDADRRGRTRDLPVRLSRVAARAARAGGRRGDAGRRDRPVPPAARPRQGDPGRLPAGRAGRARGLHAGASSVRAGAAQRLPRRHRARSTIAPLAA